METKDPFDFKDFKQQAIQCLYEGKPINGEEGIFAPLLKQLMEAALEGEMAAHLHGEELQQRNY
jgi:transposase-like protein